ncbi:MAG: spore maturation protein [Bacteriovoracaceae bacterium]|nr:spore maturation protein [Bacteriovoracaceae bacterium]
MNAIFFCMVLISFLFAAYRQFTFIAPVNEVVKAPMDALGAAMIDTAGSAVELAIGLIGVMTLFLGLMKVAEAGGLLKIIAKLVRPIMVRLFPDVPAEHPAMGAMIMNISANALGLGNAATPFGIRAMQELDKINTEKGTATNAMVLFLAINTSAVTLLPTGVIAIRAAAGSNNPAGILPTTLFATFCSTIVAIIAAKLYQRFSPGPKTEIPKKASGTRIEWASIIAIVLILTFIPLTILYGKTISPWIIPGLMMGLLAFGFFRKVPVYECFVEGAKDGFNVALKIIPYLVAILVAVSMFRTSGAMDLIITPLSKFTSLIGLPADALPMAILRPLSGSGAYGILASIIQNPAIGPDSYTGYLVSTFQGATETTFYVLAVYFGSVQIKKIRHGLAAALTADIAGILSAVFICMLLYGN